MGCVPRKNKDIFINGSNHVLCGILRLVVCLAAEAELAALFLNMREAKFLQLMLEEMSNEQHYYIHCDNSTAVSIANGTVKKQRPHSMEIQSFGLQTKLNTTLSECYDIQELKIWLIILQNIFLPPTASR